MPQAEAVIVRTGIANLASILAGFGRAGAKTRVSQDPADVLEADYVVLPGVGAFEAGMRTLEENGLVEALQTRIQQGKPTLAVCLGLQLLCEHSEEDPGVRGLGVIGEQVTRFTGTDIRIPQLGWNQVEPGLECRLIEPGYAYFANSYRLAQPPAGWRVAFADHGGRFVAAMEKGRVLACQFHPELSGPWGLSLLKRWLEADVDNGGQGC